ncbi:hypothetical protein IP88_13510 [alpha proteobacterium AAP81b]|nr:hypothetical protein IP88_13510 [alpha proteobacterium AAP81b]
MAEQELLAVDWGTSNRRIFDIGADGVRQRSDDQGILATEDFAAAIDALVLEAAGRPLLLAGMIGSNRGWVEAPYVPAPAGLADLAQAVARPRAGVMLVPGVLDAARPDVMRGEEVQLLGALATGAIGEGLVCHPGTHSKWAEIEDGAIARFRTVMTGDIFAALKRQSILSDLLAHAVDDDVAFAAGVDHALANADLTAELFTVRARVLTGATVETAAASYISGLLIGSDVRIGLGRLRADVVPLIGDPALCRQFAMALERAGRQTIVIDGADAFVAGARALAARL